MRPTLVKNLVLVESECESGNPALNGICEETGCQSCCCHDERDHGVCLDCGHEEDPGEAIDRAMDYMEDR